MSEPAAKDDACRQPYPGKPELHCLRPAGHAEDHITALGYHPLVDERGYEVGEGQYEWAEWSVAEVVR